jgi:hypothetical protein
MSDNPKIDVNTIDWDELSAAPGLTEGFIEKYKDYVNWKYITSTQKMSEDFIMKHLDKIFKNAILGIDRLSDNSHIQLTEKTFEAIKPFFHNHNVPTQMIWDLIPKFKFSAKYLNDNIQYFIENKFISRLNHIDETFILNNLNLLDDKLDCEHILLRRYILKKRIIYYNQLLIR